MDTKTHSERQQEPPYQSRAAANRASPVMAVSSNNSRVAQTRRLVAGSTRLAVQQQRMRSMIGPLLAPKSKETVVQAVTKTYPSARVNMIANWNPYNMKWPGSKKGDQVWGAAADRGSDVNAAAAKMCDDVGDITNDLSARVPMGHPHMAPQRMGGKGVPANVRPWSQTFESSNWHGALDNLVANHFMTIATGTPFYEDVETVEDESPGKDYLKPLQSLHDAAAASPDKTKLGAYLTHLNTKLKFVPKSAKIVTPGQNFAAVGNTFQPAPIVMSNAKTALLSFNGGKLENVGVSEALVSFVAALGISKEKTLNAFLNLSGSERTLLSSNSHVETLVQPKLGTLGWSSVSDMVTKLKKWEGDIEATTNLAMMYGWSHSAVLEMAVQQRLRTEDAVAAHEQEHQPDPSPPKLGPLKYDYYS